MKDNVKKKPIKVKATSLEDWLDGENVCRLLKISKKTLESYRSKHILQYSKFLKKCYYKKSDIQALLDKNYIG